MKRILIKKILYCLFIAPSFLIILIFSSCSADLGVFNNEENGIDMFYESLDDNVLAKYEESSEIKELKVDVKKSLTNEYIMDKLDWEDDADKVAFRQYSYIVIPFKRDLKIESIGLFISSDISETSTNSILEFSAFYFKDKDSCPKDEDLKLVSDPDTEIITTKDENGNDVQQEVEIKYGDPDKNDRISYTTLDITHSFDGIVLEKFHQTAEGELYVSDNCLLAKEDSYLYIRIENNSPINRNMIPIKISFINLLIRAI